MRWFARWLAVVMVSTASLAWSSPSHAFCRTTVCQKCDTTQTSCSACPVDLATGCVAGTPIAWSSSCVSYSFQHEGTVHLAAQEASAAVARAFQAWQEISCPGYDAPPAITVATSYGQAACKRHEYNQTDGNANIVMFRDDDWPYPTANNALALTTVTYNAKTGEIYDADMEINATTRLSVSEQTEANDYDLQSIVTHEAGHFLGLNHSQDSTATMWTRYSPGTQTFRRLAPDDVAGMCAIYPPSAAASCHDQPRQGFSPSCGITPTSGGSCAFAVAAWHAPPPATLGLFGFASLLAWTARRRCRTAAR